MERRRCRPRDRLHQLIDALSDDELDEVARILADRRPASSLQTVFAAAPVDDEPVTPEDEAALAEAYADVAAGRLFSHDEARRRLLERG